MIVHPDNFIRDHNGRDWALLKSKRIECVMFSADGESIRVYLKPQGVMNFKISRGTGNIREKYFLIDRDISP